MFLGKRSHIQDEIKECFPAAITITSIPTPRDIIERYLNMRLDRDTIPSAIEDNLRTEIMRVIPRKISQMLVEAPTSTSQRLVVYMLTVEYRFLLVSLNIDAVREEVAIHQRNEKLDQMIQSNGLQDAYSATLARIRVQKGGISRLGMDALI